MPQPPRHIAILLALCAAMFLTRLGATHLWDDDETFFAQVAQEMHDRGDPVVPWFNGRLFAHKPPFMYWMMIGAYKLFGVSEFSARFPSALFGTGCVLLVARLGCRLFSPATGLWAGVILATCVNFAVVARAATADAELTFFCMLPLAIFVRHARMASAADQHFGQIAAGREAKEWVLDPKTRLPSWLGWALIHASLGVAVLVKGPIGAALPFGVLLLLLLWVNAPPWPALPGATAAGAQKAETKAGLISRLLPVVMAALRWHAATFAPRRVAAAVWRMRPLTAAAAILLVAGPWFAAVGWRTRGEFLEGFFGVHHFHRFLNPMENHGGPVFYYLGIICVGFFPWILFVQPACLQWVRRLRQHDAGQSGDLLVCAWFVVWVGFFSLASTKFPHYVVPAYPALALFTARFVVGWIAQPALYAARSRRGVWITLLLVAAGFTGAAISVAPRYVPGCRGLWTPAIPLVLGAAAFAWYSERQKIQAAVASLAAAGAMFLVTLFAPVAAQIDAGQTSHVFAQALRHNGAQNPPRLATWRYFRPGLVFYVNARVEPLRLPEQAVDWLNDEGANAWLLTTEEEYAALARSLPQDVVVLRRRPWFLKSDRNLVLLSRGADPDVHRQAAGAKTLTR
jgi:4-amino-4-deoxy-L-arabinose transferase-like glycosyltransferase